MALRCTDKMMEIKPTFEVSDFRSHDMPFFDHTAARKGRVYQNGETVRYRLSGSNEVHQGLVVGFHTSRPSWVYWGGDVYPVYLVRQRNKTGTFGRKIVRLYPGDIERGYEAHAKESI